VQNRERREDSFPLGSSFSRDNDRMPPRGLRLCPHFAAFQPQKPRLLAHDLKL
jgi:hypothetical protein